MSAALARIVRILERHKTIFDLDKNGLAESLMDIDAEVILREMGQEIDPDGAGWPALSLAYLKFKSRVAPGAPMGVLYGHMKTETQIKGLRRITAREAVMVYGVDELARDLAEWFQEGSKKQNRPPRRFYKLSVEAQTRKDAFCRQHLAKLV